MHQDPISTGRGGGQSGLRYGLGFYYHFIDPSIFLYVHSLFEFAQYFSLFIKPNFYVHVPLRNLLCLDVLLTPRAIDLSHGIVF